MKAKNTVDSGDKWRKEEKWRRAIKTEEAIRAENDIDVVQR